MSKRLDMKDTRLVDFSTVQEAWSTYRLSDGNFLRIKTNLVKVRKHISARTPDGNPVYNLQSNLTIGVFTADEIAKLKEFKNKL